MPKADQKRSFYGWTVVVVGFFVYGFGIGPGYYSWGFFAPEVIAELDLSRQQVGSIFGAFTLTFALAGPLAALAFRRFGVRTTVTLGALLARARLRPRQSRRLCRRALPLLLPDRRHRRWPLHRVRGPDPCRFLVQALSRPCHRHHDVGRRGDRRHGDTGRRHHPPALGMAFRVGAYRGYLGSRSADLCRLHSRSAGTFRAAPRRSGAEEDVSADAEGSASPSLEIGAEAKTAIAPKWTALEALRTPQFAILTLTSMANIVPWRVLSAHGRLHFEDLGFTTTVAAAILGVRVGVSAVGRLSGSLGDIFSPTKVMAVSLLINGIGLGGLLFADTPTLAYSCVVFLGVGYGAAYISEPVMFAHFFGRNAFVGTSGVRLVVTGIAGFAAPTLAGAAADRTGTYSHTIAVLAVACLVASATIFFCRRPDPPGDSLQDQLRVITM